MESIERKRGSSVLAYWQVTKPRLWVMLTYTAGIGFLASLKVQPAPIFDGMLAIVAVALGTSGADSITCYLDRDVDSIMERTMHRPIPTGRIAPPSRALEFGAALASMSLLILVLAGKYIAAFIGFLGLVDNVLVYSAWLKRRSPLNVILGGFSGGAPVIVGWTVNASISLVPVLMAALVVLWIPSHIWSLALRWREDYSKAGIPMLTAVVDVRKAVMCVASTSVLMVIFSCLLALVGPFSLFYLLVAVVTGAGLVALTAWMSISPRSSAPFILFKYTSPYLAVLLAAMVI
jgi:protoheme IX farnesyltransferase